MKILMLIFLLVPVFLIGQKTATVSPKPMHLQPKPTTISLSDPWLSQDTIKKRTEILNKIFASKGFILRVTSDGCFHSCTQQYIFIDNDSVCQVLYKEKSGSFAEFPKDHVTYIISKKKFDAIKKLCFHGFEIGMNFCTTQNSFSFSDNKNMTYFVDSRCDDKDDIMQAISDLVGVKPNR